MKTCSKSRPFWISLAVWALIHATASAGTVTFGGGGPGNDWDTDANWIGGTQPTSGDFASIVFGHTAEVTSSAEFVVGGDIGGGSTLEILGGSLSFGAGGLRVGDASFGTIRHSAGILMGNGPDADLLVGPDGDYHSSGGTLSLGGDLHVAPGAVFEFIGSASTVNIGGDWQFQMGTPSTLHFRLIGDAVPTLNVAGDMPLHGSVILDLDTSMWTGDSTITLFNVSGDILDSFASVLVNGIPTNDFLISSGSVSVEVPEPSSAALLGIALVVGLCCAVGLGPVR